MKITIKITKEEKKHLKNCNADVDSCGYVMDIIKKVKKELFGDNEK